MIEDTVLLRELTNDLPLFESLRKSGSSDAHLEICKHLLLQGYRENEVILSIGQQASQFHVIIEGKVGVYVRQKSPPGVKEEQLVLARVLKSGDWLGEVSLVYNQGSLVSFVCLEEGTQCATVYARQFKQILEQFFLVRMTFQVNFIREIPVFWTWSENDLRVLYSVYTRRKLSYDQPVFLQGDPAKAVFIVKEGSFKIFKHFDDIRIRKHLDKKFKALIDSNSSHYKPLPSFEEDKNLQVLKTHQNHKNECVASIERFDLFGEEELLGKQPRKYSVICDSEYGEIFVFSKSAFVSLVMGNQKSKSYIKARLNNKQMSQVKRLDSISNYVSSAKVHVIQQNQDQIRITEDFLHTRYTSPLMTSSVFGSSSALSTQHGRSNTRQSNKSISDFTRSCIRLDLPPPPPIGSNTIASSPTLDMQQQQQQIPQSTFFGTSRQTTQKNLAESVYSLGSRSQFTETAFNPSNLILSNHRTNKNEILSRSSVNFKSLNNLTLKENVVNTKYFANESTIKKIEPAANKLFQEQEKKRSDFMKKYYEKFNFNIVDSGYSQRIINQCTELSNKEYSQNKKYAKGAFHNKLGMRGQRCLGIDQIKDTNTEFEKAKLQVQAEFDPDFKLKSLESRR